MASEITTTFGMTYANGELNDPIEPFQTVTDQTTVGIYSNTQTIGTTAETVTIGADIVAHGMCFVKNLDDTNFIEIGPDSTGIVNFFKLLPGKWAWFPLHPSATVKAKADAADCKLFIKLLDA